MMSWINVVTVRVEVNVEENDNEFDYSWGVSSEVALANMGKGENAWQ